ncbi:MAG: hypothetical protein AAF849_00655 [Bacteroidota bacterium]
MKFEELVPPFHNEYESENLDYADKARKIICDALGFEPDLKASRLAELNLRKSLKRFDAGELDERQIKVHISQFCNIVKKRVLSKVPEQAHLVNQEEVENFTLPPRQ